MEDMHVFGGREALVLPVGAEKTEGLPMIFRAAEENISLEAGKMRDALRDIRKPFALAVFPVKDWDAELTPWPAPALFKGGDFSGGAAETLEWLRAYKAFAQARHGASTESTGLCGYSLAGLFALWSLYNTADFTHIGCCSGSLWYDGWLPYIEVRHPRSAACVYLSLGRAEEKARNTRMREVGNALRRTEEVLSREESIRDMVIHWEDGGHFTDPEGRMARCLRWLCERL